MIKISPSILASNNRIESTLKLNNTNSDYLHIDVMDGKFVENFQFPLEEINEIEKISKKPLDIHLMVENPENYITKLRNKNIEFITFHIEINQNIKNIISLIKSLNYKVGISLKPNTKVEEILEYLPLIHLVLIMTVEPGFGGQEFIHECAMKIPVIKEEFTEAFAKALTMGRPVVIDCQIDKDEKVWPMVAPGAAISEAFSEEDL